MHRVKCLEFEWGVLAGANAQLLPLHLGMAEISNEGELATIEGLERAHVYVAASRAQNELLLLSHMKPSRFLRV